MKKSKICTKEDCWHNEAVEQYHSWNKHGESKIDWFEDDWASNVSPQEFFTKMAILSIFLIVGFWLFSIFIHPIPPNLN